MTITLQHTLIEMPKNDYQPRFDDPRVGYFSTQVTDLTSKSATPYRDLIHRWHLKKRDPKAKRSEPVVPITYWIENTTPKELRPTIKKAALAWNIAFEAAGFKMPCRSKNNPMMPIGTPAISDTMSCAGPHRPIHHLADMGRALSTREPDKYWVPTSCSNLHFSRAACAMTSSLTTRHPMPIQTCPILLLGHELHVSNLFGTQALRVSGASKLEIDALLKDSVYYLILHEIGHTLGLNTT